MKNQLRWFIAVTALTQFAVNALAAIPATASRYRIEIFTDTPSHQGSHRHPAQNSAYIWQVWHQGNATEIQQQGAPYAVVWERLSSGAVQRSEVHHAFKTVVRYTPGDARLLGTTRQWQWSARLFDGTLLQSLEKKGMAEFAGQQGQRYEGKIDGLAYNLIWKEKTGVPVLIEVRGKNRHERITLLDTHLRADKPYPHVDWESQYDELDYVDLGDNEAHPLVRAMHNMESKVYYPGSHH